MRMMLSEGYADALALANEMEQENANRQQIERALDARAANREDSKTAYGRTSRVFCVLIPSIPIRCPYRETLP